MPINLSVGGKNATDAELQQRIMDEEAKFQSEQAGPEVAPEDVGRSDVMVDEALGGINRQPTQQAIVNNFGYTNEEVKADPIKYGQVQYALREATGDKAAVPQFDFDDAPGAGPIGRRIGQNKIKPNDAGFKDSYSPENRGGAQTGSMMDSEVGDSQRTPEQIEELANAQQLQADLNDKAITNEQLRERHGLKNKNPGMVGDYKAMSSEVHNTVQRLGTYMTTQGKKSLAESIASEANKKGQPVSLNSVQKVMQGVVTNYAYAQQKGIPRAFSDIILAAGLLSGKKAYTKMIEEEEAALKGVDKDGNPVDALGNVDTQEQTALSTGTDQSTGRMINEAMGLEASNETNAIMGAIARKIMADTFDGAINKESPFFQTTKRAVAEGGTNFQKQYNATELTRAGKEAYDTMEPLIDKILPGTKLVPRSAPKVTKSDINAPRRTSDDRKADVGSFKAANEFIDIAKNTPVGFDYTKNDPTSLGFFMSSNADNAILNEMLGYKLDDNGSVIEFEEELGPDGRKLKHMPNAMLKDQMEQDVEWIQTNGAKPAYFDYFIGGNNRIYVDQTIANWQNRKLPRALLQSASMIKYDLDNTAVLHDLQAGIMKKLGDWGEIKFDKSNVDKSVEHFNEFAQEMSNAMRTINDPNAAQDAVQAAKDLIMNTAKAGEGLAGLSAIMEAVKLYDHMQNPGRNPNIPGRNNKAYFSKFLTEVDGTANGLAHSAMQGGLEDAKVNAALNLYGEQEMKDLAKGKPFDDAYIMTTDSMLEFIGELPDINEKQKAAFKEVLIRDVGKGATMVFGYGAAGETVGSTAWAKFEKKAGEEAIKSLENVDLSRKRIQKIVESTAWDAVSKDFAAIKLVNNTMKRLVKLAKASGLGPSLIIPTFLDHNVILGQRETAIDEDAFDGTEPRVEYKLGADGEVGGGPEGLGVSAQARKRTTDSYGGEMRVNSKGEEYLALKASSQSGVLGIHAMDAINIIESFRNFYKKNKNANAFQVFDGVLMPPLHAREWAKQLNDDFYRINIEYSLAEAFAAKLEDAGVVIDPETNHLLAKIHGQRERNAKRLKQDNVRQFLWDRPGLKRK